MDQHPLTIILLGAIALLVLYAWPGAAPAVVTTATADMVPDQWDTPYYLRYNTNIYNSGRAVMPLPPQSTYALGVPGPSLGARNIIILGGS